MKNIMFGVRVLTYEGEMVFRDDRNRLTCRLQVGGGSKGSVAEDEEAGSRNGSKGGASGSKKGGGFWKRKFGKGKGSPDMLSGRVVCDDEPSVALATFEGNWITHLDCDGERLWESSMPTVRATRFSRKLPSDSSLRPDCNAVAAREWNRAQRAKEMLENRQRADAKLRKEALKRIAKAEKATRKI